jgi:flagellar hook-associated protein 2
VKAGGASAVYSATAGESLSSIAQGLDASFASAGMSLSAQVVTSGGKSHLQIASSGYGSQQSFTVATGTSGELGISGSYAGTNVAGTIDGVAATGNGQILSAPVDNPTLAGLSLQVTTQGITSATTIGNYTYSPGVAQQLASLGSSLTSPGGQVTSQISSEQTQATGLNPEIASYQQMAKEEKTLLEQTYSQLDATLAGLQQQSSMLSSQMGGASSGGSSGGSSIA